MPSFNEAEGPVNSRSLNKFIARLPNGMRDWLADQAAKNASSMNSEVVRAIRERMDKIAASEMKRRATAGRVA